MNQQIANYLVGARLQAAGRFYVNSQRLAAMLYEAAMAAKHLQNKKFLQQQAAFWSVRDRKARGLGE